jgi:hypothetical protein
LNPSIVLLGETIQEGERAEGGRGGGRRGTLHVGHLRWTLGLRATTGTSGRMMDSSGGGQRRGGGGRDTHRVVGERLRGEHGGVSSWRLMEVEREEPVSINMRESTPANASFPRPSNYHTRLFDVVRGTGKQRAMTHK